MKIGVINAMEDEHARLASHLTEAHEQSCGLYSYVEGRLGANTLVLTRCGIGKVNAALGAAELIRRFSPDCIVSPGVDGGTGDGLQVTAGVAGAGVASPDVWWGDGKAYGQGQGLPAVFEADPRLLACARRLSEAGGLESRIHCGLICTGDQFITDRAKLDAIRAAFPDVQAVDMESAAIAQTCYLYKVPFISFRIVSDTPGSEGHWQQYLDFWGTVADRSFHATKAFLEVISD